MLASCLAHAFPDRAGQALRSNADVVVDTPATSGQECHRYYEQPAALRARRPDHLRGGRLLAMQVAAVAELAIRPVIAGLADPAAAGRKWCTSSSCCLACRPFRSLSPSKIRRGRERADAYARAKRSRGRAGFTGCARSTLRSCLTLRTSNSRPRLRRPPPPHRLPAARGARSRAARGRDPAGRHTCPRR